MRVLLKERRRLQGLTMREAAAKIGISTSHYSRIEHGTRTPSVFVAIKISKIFGVPMDELFKETAKFN